MSEHKTITTREELKEWLQYEHRVYGNVSGLKVLMSQGEKAVLWKHQKLLRKAEYYLNTRKGLLLRLTRFRLLKLQSRYAIHVPLNSCGKGLKIMHVGPVLINKGAVLGKDCVLHMNVGIVAGGTNDDAPVLGDRVIVGYGAVILGKTRIADSVAVGANAVVNKDVTEEDIAVAGVPARKVSDRGRSAWAKGASKDSE